jgi:hypothetical protein
MRKIALAMVILVSPLFAAGCRDQAQPQPQGQVKPPQQPREREQPSVPDAALAKVLAAAGKTTTAEERVAWVADLGEHLRRGQPSVPERRLIADVLDACDREDPVPGLLLLAQDLEMGRLFRSGMVHLLSDEHGCAQSVAPLVNILKTDVVPEVRARVASELAGLYLEGHVKDLETIVAALIGALADKEERVRDLAAWSLGCLAESERGLIARLEKLKEHEDPNVRAAAAEALRNVRPRLPKKPTSK